MHKSAGAIIRDREGRILMHERVSFPPGLSCAAGHVEDGETPEQAMMREIKEETGLNVLKYSLIYHEFVPWNKCSRGMEGHDWFLYEVQEWSGEIILNKREAKRIAWMTIDEIKKYRIEEVWEYWFKKLKIL